MAEFVSYSGKWPNLCSGTLTLRIDGKEEVFGYDSPNGVFWSSGGACYFVDDDTRIEHDAWQLREDMLPERFQKYKEEMLQVFNDNVEFGCCGGCL